MADTGGNESARALGAEIRSRRLAQGMSLRALAKALGLAAHGTLVDYEYGRRIPPEDLIVGCERVFQISDGALRNLRDKALAERAYHQADLLRVDPRPAGDTTTAPPAADDSQRPAPARRRLWHRRPVLLVGAGLVALAGVLLGVSWLGSPATGSTAPRSSSAASAPFSRTVVARWGICWGGQAGSLTPVDAVTYEGADALQITVDKPGTAGLFATCTHHGLSTLRPGMKVTVYLRVPTASSESGGVGFWVYNSSFKAAYAPETPLGAYEPLPATTGWQKYTWTVPAVDTVNTLGIEVDSTTDRPVIIWLGAVTW